MNHLTKNIFHPNCQVIMILDHLPYYQDTKNQASHTCHPHQTTFHLQIITITIPCRSIIHQTRNIFLLQLHITMPSQDMSLQPRSIYLQHCLTTLNQSTDHPHILLHMVMSLRARNTCLQLIMLSQGMNLLLKSICLLTQLHPAMIT